MNENKPILEYATPRSRIWPVWAHAGVLLLWPLGVMIIYGGALSGVALTVLSVVNIIHPIPDLRSSGEPLPTNWQNAELMLRGVGVSLLFIPLAIWHVRWSRRSSRKEEPNSVPQIDEAG